MAPIIAQPGARSSRSQSSVELKSRSESGTRRGRRGSRTGVGVIPAAVRRRRTRTASFSGPVSAGHAHALRDPRQLAGRRGRHPAGVHPALVHWPRLQRGAARHLRAPGPSSTPACATRKRAARGRSSTTSGPAHVPPPTPATGSTSPRPRRLAPPDRAVLALRFPSTTSRSPSSPPSSRMPEGTVKSRTLARLARLTPSCPTRRPPVTDTRARPPPAPRPPHRRRARRPRPRPQPAGRPTPAPYPRPRRRADRVATAGWSGPSRSWPHRQ